jgi:hypothetical protein
VALAGQVAIIGTRAPDQEVGLDPLDQRLDAALLIGRPRPAGLGVEVELGRQLQQGRVPDRLLLGVPTGGDRLHVVQDQHPPHEPQRTEALDQPAEQRRLPHLGREAHPGPAAVLESAGQEVARGRRLLGEREAAHLAPIHLQVLARQALKPTRHVGDGLRLRLG